MNHEMKAGELVIEMRRGFQNLKEDIAELENPDSIISLERFMRSVNQYFDAKEAYDFWKQYGGGDRNMTVGEIMDRMRRTKRQEKSAETRKEFFQNLAKKATSVADRMDKASRSE